MIAAAILIALIAVAGAVCAWADFLEAAARSAEGKRRR